MGTTHVVLLLRVTVSSHPYNISITASYCVKLHVTHYIRNRVFSCTVHCAIGITNCEMTVIVSMYVPTYVHTRLYPVAQLSILYLSPVSASIESVTVQQLSNFEQSLNCAESICRIFLPKGLCPLLHAQILDNCRTPMHSHEPPPHY